MSHEAPGARLSETERRFMEIAREKRFLTPAKLDEALRAHQAGSEHFAEACCRLRLLTAEEAGRILWMAKSRGRRPGEFIDEFEWLLGNLLVGKRRILHQDLYAALLLQANLEARGQAFPLGEILVHRAKIQRAELDEVLDEQRRKAGAASAMPPDGAVRCTGCGAVVRPLAGNAPSAPCFLCGAPLPPAPPPRSGSGRAAAAPPPAPAAPPTPAAPAPGRGSPFDIEAARREILAGADDMSATRHHMNADLDLEAARRAVVADSGDAGATARLPRASPPLAPSAPASAPAARGSGRAPAAPAPLPELPPIPGGSSTRGRLEDILSRATVERSAAGIDALLDLDLTDTELGPYLIQRKIGEGAIGMVYLAEHRGLGRVVALKLLSPKSSSDPEAIARFEQEARTAGRLVHPNIAIVYDVGRVASYSYMAMEYVEGVTLERILTERRLTIDEALGFLKGLVGALATAHRMGIVHRDVKPGNIMVDPSSQVKLMDFGLARDLWGPSRTRMGAIMGTPLYMSPEQARGGAVDRGSDIFSLGVISYYMIAGQNPFRAPTVPEILTRVQTHEPPRVRSLAPDCPPPLADLVHRMLDKNPETRLSNLDEVVVCVDRCRDAISSGAHAPAPRPRPSRVVPLLIGLVLVGAAAAALHFGGYLRRGPPAGDLAAVTGLIDRGLVAEARSSLEDLRRRYGETPETAALQSDLEMRERLEACLDAAEAALGTEPPDLARARDAVDEARVIWGIQAGVELGDVNTPAAFGRSVPRAAEIQRLVSLIGSRQAAQAAAAEGRLDEARRLFDEALGYARTPDERARTQALREQALGAP